MAIGIPRGRFIWHELLTTDPPAAIKFYERLVGWTVTSWEQDPNYRIFTWKGSQMAGLMLLPEEARKGGAPPHWLSYVAVPDVDATVRQILDRGGKAYVEPMDIPTVGRIAVLADPQGAVFGVYRPTLNPAGGDDVGVGDFSWHELATTDWQTAWEFYRGLFGWEFDSQFDMGPAGTYWMFRRAKGSRTLGGMFNKPPEIPVPNWLPYIKVPEADRAAEAARHYGGAVLNGPMEVPGGDRVAQLLDVQGAAIAVHSLAPKGVVVPPPAPKPAPKAAKKRTAKKPTARKAAAKKPAAKKAARRKPAKKAAPRGRPVKKAAKKR